MGKLFNKNSAKAKKNRDKKQLDIRHEFLSSALEIVEKPSSVIGTYIIYGIFFIILSCILFASIAKIDEVSVARGKLIPDGRVKVVQSIDEGIITGIYVDEGERVHKGQLLLDLDSTLKNVDKTAIEKSITIATLETQLLENIMHGDNIQNLDMYIQSKNIDFSLKHNLLEFAKSKLQDNKDKKQKMQLLYEQAQKEYANEKEELEKLKIELLINQEKQYSLHNINNTPSVETIALEKLQKAVAKMQKDLTVNKNLLEQGVISEQEYKDKEIEFQLLQKEYEIQAKRQKTAEQTIDINYKTANSLVQLSKKNIEMQHISIQSAQKRLEEARLSLDNIDNIQESEMLNQIVEKQKQISSLKLQLEKINKSLKFQQITSPTDGLVQAIGFNTIGAVVKPAQSIITIVPEDTKLVIEAYVKNRDIGYVKKGQQASIKVDTYSFQNYGTLEGTIDNISPDAIDDKRQGLVYKVRVTINDNQDISKKISQIELSSGMAVTVEIKTGKRRIIKFFLDPLIKHIDEGIKVR